MTMAHENFGEFLRKFDPDGTRIKAEITAERDKNGNSPFIVIHHGEFTVVLSAMPFEGDAAHLCIDVHPFVGGEDATAGVFGMSTGRRFRLQDTGTTSHGWASANLIAVLVGKQARS